jgi:hypothetical protein
MTEVFLSACRGGDVKVLSNLMENTSYLKLAPSGIEGMIDKKSFGSLSSLVAAEFGHLSIIKYFLSIGIVDVGRAIEKGALNSHIDVLDFLQQHTAAKSSPKVMDGNVSQMILNTNDLFTEAAIRGDISIVEWLHRNRIEGCTARALIGAAGNGHREVVEFLVTHRGDLGNYIDLAFTAACGSAAGKTVIEYFVNELQVRNLSSFCHKVSPRWVVLPSALYGYVFGETSQH